MSLREELPHQQSAIPETGNGSAGMQESTHDKVRELLELLSEQHPAMVAQVIAESLRRRDIENLLRSTPVPSTLYSYPVSVEERQRKTVDCEALSNRILGEIQQDIERYRPVMAIVEVGSKAESSSYIKSIMRLCKKVNMECVVEPLPHDCKAEDAHHCIARMNNNPRISGVIAQLPLPFSEHEQETILRSIDPNKDIDGFGFLHLGKVAAGKEDLAPATAMAALKIIEHEGIDFANAEFTLVGAGTSVGRPLASMLAIRQAHYTLCNVNTKNLAEHTRNADVIVSAVGRGTIILPEMVKPGALVINVGAWENAEGNRIPDVHEDVIRVAGRVTPFIKGTGLITTTMLIEHTLRARQIQLGLRR